MYFYPTWLLSSLSRGHASPQKYSFMTTLNCHSRTRLTAISARLWACWTATHPSTASVLGMIRATITPAPILLCSTE